MLVGREATAETSQTTTSNRTTLLLELRGDVATGSQTRPDDSRRHNTTRTTRHETRRDETRQTRLSYLTCSHYLRSVLPVSYLTYLQHPLPAAATGLAARFYLPSTRCTAWRVNHGGVRMVAASRTDGLVVAECQSGRLGQPVRVWGH